MMVIREQISLAELYNHDICILFIYGKKGNWTILFGSYTYSLPTSKSQ